MSPLNTPILSVIAVTYNDVVGIRETLKSLEVLIQDAGVEVEILVQDGGTGHEFATVVHEFGSRVKIESAPDSGIYDAMNRGILRSRGSYLWFLNGGDVNLIDKWETIRGLISEASGNMILGGYGLRSGSRYVVRKPRGIKYLWHGLPTSHQAIFYPRDSVAKVMYETRFSIVGDYALTSRLFSSGIKATRTNIVVADFMTGGTSQQQAKSIAKEARIVQREILDSPLPMIQLSSALHGLSRVRRSLYSKL